MKVYVYRETNDNESFNAELVKVFADRIDAIVFLRKRVEEFFHEPWERVVSIIDDDDDIDGAIWPTYVEYPDGNGYNFFAIDEHEVEESK